MVPDQRYAQRLFIHVERPRPVTLAPNAVLPRVPALIGGENDKRVVANPHLVETPDDAPYVGIQARDQRRVGVHGCDVALVGS